MECAITGFIEETQLVQKEVDFTCYISTIQGRLSSLNFNQMITRTPQTFNRKFLVPDSLAPNDAHTLQCEAGYYNLGSRVDSFFDTFVVTENVPQGAAGVSAVQPETLIEKVKDKIDKVIEKIKDARLVPKALSTSVIVAICIVLFSVILIFTVIIISARRKKNTNSLVVN